MTVAAERRVRPQSASELARTLREADEAHLAVIPWGAGAQQYVGNPPLRADLILETTALSGVVEHTPADLTVTVAAGTRLGELNEVLARAGQHLPLDPPHGSVATIGGLIATNASGPRRQRHGTLRDLLIGTRTALVDGTVVRSGGKVVKNVAGYDLNKLLIGSLGTLGVVVEATFKVLPLPAREEALTATFATLGEAFEAGTRLARAALRPTAIEVHHPLGEPTLLVVAEGEPAPVRRTLDDAAAIARECGARAVERWEEAEPLLADARGWLERVTAGALVRSTLPLAAQARYVEELQFLAQVTGCALRVSAHAGVGVVRAHLLGPPGALLSALSEAMPAAARLDGESWFERLGSDLRPELDAWNGEPSGVELMRRIKSEFDPKGTLNPGRFVGGI